jgi:cation transport ATPase
MPEPLINTNAAFRGSRRSPRAWGKLSAAMRSPALRKSYRLLLAGIAAAGLGIGLAVQLAGHAGSAWIWTVGTLPVLAALVGEIVTGLRRGNLGLDIIAALSMTAALIVGQELAAAVVAVMYSGGQFLELFAEQRARREMTALLERVPRATMRHHEGRLEEVRGRPRPSRGVTGTPAHDSLPACPGAPSDI